jgi:cytochrome o ubiquinol oxidase subunit 1
VTGEDPFWQFKKRMAEQPGTEEKPEYRDIEIPRNSPTGFVCAFFATVMGFALIWHIWWMVAVGLIGAFATFVVFAWRDHDEDTIPADEVARIDRNNRTLRHAMLSKQAAE